MIRKAWISRLGEELAALIPVQPGNERQNQENNRRLLIRRAREPFEGGQVADAAKPGTSNGNSQRR